MIFVKKKTAATRGKLLSSSIDKTGNFIGGGNFLTSSQFGTSTDYVQLDKVHKLFDL